MERESGERGREQTWPDSAEPRAQHDDAEKHRSGKTYMRDQPS
jgi:hypothetical protein